MGLPKLFFDNRFADGIPVASSTAAGNYAAANVADMRPYTWWKANALPATLTTDCGSAKLADFALILGHDLYTQGASVEVRGSNDNFSTSDVLVDSFTPTSDDPFLMEFTVASYRYWRAAITGPAGNKPVVAMVLLGVAFVIPKSMQAGFDPLARMAEQASNNNDNGNPLGKIIQHETWKETLLFKNLSWDWVRSEWQAAWRAHLRGSPFVFAWDSIRYPSELYLVSISGKYSTPHQRAQLADLSFEVRGRAD